MAEIKYTELIDTANNLINNEGFVKFGIHLFLGQKGAIDNYISIREQPILKKMSTSMSTVKATNDSTGKTFREPCINFPIDLKKDTKINDYITALTEAELKTTYNNEDQIVNSTLIGNEQLGATGNNINGDHTGIKRALKAVVECFIRKDAKKNNNYDLFRKWLVLEEGIPNDGVFTVKDAISKWIKYRIENSTDKNIRTFKNIDNIVNTLSSSAFITEKNEVKVIGTFNNLSDTETNLKDIKITFEKLSKSSREEFATEAAKKGNSLYNDLLVQNQLMRYFIKEADKTKVVEPNATIDKIIIDLQYFQCKVLVAILDKDNNGLDNGIHNNLEAKLNIIAANTNKFTGNSVNNNEDAGAVPGNKPGWRWSGGGGDAGIANNLHDVKLESKADIKIDYYKTMLGELKNLYETKIPQIPTVSHINPLEHLQLIADLAVAKSALKLIDNGKDYGELNISNAGLIAYRIHEDIKKDGVKDETFNLYDNEMKGLVKAYETKADTNGAGNTHGEFKAIVGKAPSMRIAIVGASVDRNDDGKINIDNIISNIDKIAAIHYAIFRAAADAADIVDPKIIPDVFNHNEGCQLFAVANVDNAHTDPNKPIWKRAIKAAISTANTCFSNITF
jgi:hypothetical protein